jgi:hypothetical protein
MKIKTVNLINVVGMNRTIEAKDANLFPGEYGVEVMPKGAPSFKNRPRFIPWANVSSCDIFTDEELEKVQVDEAKREEARLAALQPIPADPITVPIEPDRPPEPTVPGVDDVIRFTKNAAGQTVESRGSKPAGDPVKNAFARASAAKAEVKPE